MAEFVDWFNQIPPFTRYWFGGSVVVPILCRFNILSPYSMIFTPDFLKNLHLWKPITSVLYYPLNQNTGFHFLTNLYFIYNFSKKLELGYFSGRPADFAFMLLFNWTSLLILAWVLGIYVLMDSMVMSVIYVYCIINQDQIISFWFGTRFKARYLPWALFGLSFILKGGGLDEFIGIIVGHLYYFVVMKYPADQGVTLINTPEFMNRLFPNNQPRQYVPAARQDRAETPAAPTNYDWGRGRRLD